MVYASFTDDLKDLYHIIILNIPLKQYFDQFFLNYVDQLNAKMPTVPKGSCSASADFTSGPVCIGNTQSDTVWLCLDYCKFALYGRNDVSTRTVDNQVTEQKSKAVFTAPYQSSALTSKSRLPPQLLYCNSKQDRTQ